MKTFIKQSIQLLIVMSSLVFCIEGFAAAPALKAVGGADILQNIGNNVTSGANHVSASQVRSDSEYHFVTVNGTTNVQNYLPYVQCANGNGASFVPGSLQVMGTNTGTTYLYYFCTAVVNPWYYTSTNPVYYYDQAKTVTYAQVGGGLVSWSNPLLGGSGAPSASEQISTNSTYKNGPPLLTLYATTCDNNFNYTTTVNSKIWNVLGAFWANATVTANLSGGSTTYTGSATVPSSTVSSWSAVGYSQTPSNYCNGTYATVSVPVMPGVVISVNISFSNLIGIWGGYLGPYGNTNYALFYGFMGATANQSSFTGSATIQALWHMAASNVCAGTLVVPASYVPTPTSTAVPVYIACSQGNPSTLQSDTRPPIAANANWYGSILIQY